MYGFYCLKTNNEIYSISIYKTSKEDLINLKHEKFLNFSKNYAVSKQMSLLDILEMEDEFMEFISDIGTFISLNSEMAKDIFEIVDEIVCLDETGLKNIETLAKDYSIKFLPEESQKVTYLSKVLLMVFRKQLLKQEEKQEEKQENNSIVALENIAIEETVKLESEGVIIDGIILLIDFNKKHELSPNGQIVFNLFKKYFDNKKEISMTELVKKYFSNFKVFFIILNEFVEKKIITKQQLTELKTIYFEINQNERYQEYIKASLLKGIDLKTFKEQLDLLYYMKY